MTKKSTNPENVQSLNQQMFDNFAWEMTETINRSSE